MAIGNVAGVPGVAGVAGVGGVPGVAPVKITSPAKIIQILLRIAEERTDSCWKASLTSPTSPYFTGLN